MLIELEQIVATHLKNSLPSIGLVDEKDCRIEVIPDDSSQQYKMLHPTSTLWVRFDGEETKLIGLQADETTASFTVIVMTRNLRQHNGAYAMIELVKKAFRFCLIPNWGMTRNLRVRFKGKLENTTDVWVYEVQLTVIVQNIV